MLSPLMSSFNHVSLLKNNYEKSGCRFVYYGYDYHCNDFAFFLANFYIGKINNVFIDYFLINYYKLTLLIF